MTATPSLRSLYCENHPARFWHPIGDSPTDRQWADAIAWAAHVLPEAAQKADIDEILVAVLGEGQFGPGHWRLGSAKRLYYRIKPLLPRSLTQGLRRAYRRSSARRSMLGWPVEDRYAQFLAGVVRALLDATQREHLDFIHFWPAAHRFALVLTHDIETAAGQANVLSLADLEMGLGLRSSFNFVPRRYRVDTAIMKELRDRGFEVAVHDLRHDGKLFSSRARFADGARSINRHLAEYQATGFRAGLTHRHQVWMQELSIEYDMSFFDTDPFEPISGGTMSIWPFSLGRFLELPYTLAQDNTLISVLKERSPRLWLEKVDYVASRHGLALVNSHPDYLTDSASRGIYAEFLETMATRNGYWAALPMEVCRWWRARDTAASLGDLPDATVARIGEGGWESINLLSVERTVSPVK